MRSPNKPLLTAALYATGAEGPLRSALDRLRAVGLGERMLKGALAAGVAWQAALLLHANPLPTLAPLTALFTIQATVAQSIGGTTQRLLGVIFGIFVALAMQATIGANAITIGVLVLACLAGGRALGLEQSGVEQLAVTAMLVLIAGSVTGNHAYWKFHLLDTAVGAAVGIALNGLIAPPNHVDPARASVQALGQRLTDVLDDLAAGFAEGMDRAKAESCLLRARAIAADLTRTQQAIARAGESLRFNLVGKPQRSALGRYQSASRALEHCAVQTRVISRTTLDATSAPGIEPLLTSNPLSDALAELFSAIARYLEYFLAALDDREREQTGVSMLADVRERRAAAEVVARAEPATFATGAWVLLGELLSISDQLITDLATDAAVDDARSDPAAATSSAISESVENERRGRRIRAPRI